MEQDSLKVADAGWGYRGASEVREGRSPLKAKDLVGLLLCHGARAWRASQPVAHTRLTVQAPAGHAAVRLRFG